MIAHNKDSLRQLLKTRREAISPCRRQQSAKKTLKAVQSLSKDHKLILSYASFGSELSTTLINQHLLNQNQLVLPRVIDNHLKLYRVTNLNQLIPCRRGIPSPRPSKALHVDPKEVSLAFIPALGFDKRGHRLGYGKGCYDRLLKNMPSALSLGLGFHEQCLEFLLPVAPHDIALSQLFLF
ncbi:MAG: 5-formyltetrahydrofolate cyclo-ligase [Chlamydiota bacterium]